MHALRFNAGLSFFLIYCLSGCSQPIGNGNNNDNDNGSSQDDVLQGHADVVLRDRFSNPIPVGSTEPYSPRQTCGECHDVDAVANGYHFQQGRTNMNGRIMTQNNFFGDGRTWIKSAGMYGKW